MPIAQSFLDHKYISYDGNFYWIVLRCPVFVLFLREEPEANRDVDLYLLGHQIFISKDNNIKTYFKHLCVNEKRSL